MTFHPTAVLARSRSLSLETSNGAKAETSFAGHVSLQEAKAFSVFQPPHQEPPKARQAQRALLRPQAFIVIVQELLRPEQILVASSETHFIRTSDLVAKASEHRVSGFVRSDL